MVARRKCEWTRVYVSPLFQSHRKATFRLGRARPSQKAKLIGLASVATEWSPHFGTSAPQKQLGLAAGALTKMFIIKGGRPGTETQTRVSSWS